jgi:hypothetical protein
MITKPKTVQHNIKKMEMKNNIDKMYDRDEYKNKILQPIKLEKKKINIVSEIEKKKKQLDDCEKEGSKKRTNHPYKGIIKKFDYDKKLNDEKDLIVFYAKDEIKDDFDDNLKNHKALVKKQDKDIADIYTEDEKLSHTKKFEYVQKYKYLNCTDEVSDSTNLRVDRIEHYKKSEPHQSAPKINIADITDEDLEKINVDDLEKRLIAKYGLKKYKQLMEQSS